MTEQLMPDELAALAASPKCVRCGHRELVHYAGEETGCIVCGWQKCRDLLLEWQPLGFAEAEAEAYREPSWMELMYVNTIKEYLVNPPLKAEVRPIEPGKIIRWTTFGELGGE